MSNSNPTPAGVDSVVKRSIQRLGRDPDTALQHLIAVQQTFSFVPSTAVESLVRAIDVTSAQLLAAVDFYAFLSLSPRGDYDILFSDNISDRMLGNQQLMRELCKLLDVVPDRTRADGRVRVGLTSCTGMCDQAPALLVNGFALTRLDEHRVRRIAALVNAGAALPNWPQEFFAVTDHVQRRGLLLDDLQSRDAGVAALLSRGSDAILAEIERAGLRGRGGAGFSTALKWRLCRESANPHRVVVCNADEGEPGTFKDRVLLSSYADLMVEGMTLCAGIVNACDGFIYLRGEYRYLLEHLESVLQRRREQGLLGQAIGGRVGFDFDIRIHLGAGAYICGEESALIESLEGKRGIPRKRPPFPVIKGYLERPTVVNNVETLVAAARIAEHGGAWFRGEGTGQSAGSKLLSVSGDCARPGIYEVPFGTSIAEVLDDCGAWDTQAVQLSGAAGKTLGVDEFQRLLAFEDLPTAGALMIFDQSRDLLDMVCNFADFFTHESCGFCTPCRVGGKLLRDLVAKVAAGQARRDDLAEMRHIANVMRRTSHCGLGHTAPNPVLDTLDKFPAIYASRLRSENDDPAFDLEAALSEARALSGATNAQPKPVPTLDAEV